MTLRKNEMSITPLRQTYTQLKIEILKGQKGGLLFLNSSGLQGSKRQSDDGCCYFGVLDTLNGEIVNDYVLPTDESLEGQQGRHFVIYYQDYLFWLRDLSIGFGVYIKLDYAMLLKDNMMLSTGDSFFIVNLQGSELSIKAYSSTLAGQAQ